MESDFATKLVSAITKFTHQTKVFQQSDCLKIVCECIYCGRSKRGLPHMGIVIYPESDGKITGGINCFRCGVSKPLKSFLFDIREVVAFYGITLTDIDRNVIVCESKEKAITLDLKSVAKNTFIEQNNFYAWIRKKYGDDKQDLQRRIFFSMNAFMFLKNRLKLNFNTSLYNAYRILKDVKCRAYLGQNDRYILSFDSKVRYVFDRIEPQQIAFEDERDIMLCGIETFPFVFKSYTKLKSPPSGGTKYYIVKDTNCGEVDTYDIMNVYVAEGVFDTLSMKFYKNIFNLGDVNRIDLNIVNLYVAMAHSRIDKFVSEYFLGVAIKSSSIPDGIKCLNFIMVPDLNMNVNRYVFNLYKFIHRYYNELRSMRNNLVVKVYYLDLFDIFGGYDLEMVKDINDIVRNFPKRTLRKVGLVEIL